MSVGVAAWRELEARRRRSRLRNVGLAGLLFRTYVAVLLGGMLVLVFGGWIAGPRFDAATVSEISARGPAALGAVAALALLFGARNGLAGGPITVDRPTVRHVLLSPVPRSVVLRRLARTTGSRAVLVGTAVGIAAGGLAAIRLEVSDLIRIGSLATFGGVVGALWFSAAVIMAGHASRVLIVVPGVLCGWSVAEIITRGRTSPFSVIGMMALAPRDGLSVGARAGSVVVGVVIVGAIAIAGVASIPRLSVERVDRRSQLVSLLRFSFAMRDLRAVVLLRRRLVDERRRDRPWVAVGVGGRWPVWHRDWAAAMRWPAVRWLRIAACCVGAAYATAIAVSGTRALSFVAAALQFAAAVEATEGLAEDADHPTLRRGLPRGDGAIWLAHLPSAVAFLVAAELLAILSLLPAVGLQAFTAAVVIVPSAVVACAQAGWVAIREPLSPADLIFDDLGFLQATHVLGPVAWGGIAPIAAAVAAPEYGTTPTLWLVVAAITTVAAVASVTHLRYRDRIVASRIGAAFRRLGLR